MRAPSRTAVIAGAAALLAVAWWFWWRSDERAIRRELSNLAADVNAPAGEGLGVVSWAAQVGTHFTEDAVLDLAGGSPPIEGRRAVAAMAVRYQPWVLNGTVAIEDVIVTAGRERGTADVDVTVTFTPAGDGRREETVDARGFALQMKRDGRRWRIARATAAAVEGGGQS